MIADNWNPPERVRNPLTTIERTGLFLVGTACVVAIVTAVATDTFLSGRLPPFVSGVVVGMCFSGAACVVASLYEKDS